jgi:hypothetical protein
MPRNLYLEASGVGNNTQISPVSGIDALTEINAPEIDDVLPESDPEPVSELKPSNEFLDKGAMYFGNATGRDLYVVRKVTSDDLGNKSLTEEFYNDINKDGKFDTGDWVRQTTTKMYTDGSAEILRYLIDADGRTLANDPVKTYEKDTHEARYIAEQIKNTAAQQDDVTNEFLDEGAMYIGTVTGSTDVGDSYISREVTPSLNSGSTYLTEIVYEDMNRNGKLDTGDWKGREVARMDPDGSVQIIYTSYDGNGNILNSQISTYKPDTDTARRIAEQIRNTAAQQASQNKSGNDEEMTR